ncbi:MAG: hypothetical protein C0602_08230 [Denitrovibrio sp.]|nr:MAG: hypothetical protein C0602_08230 [Denitrovibrio sp.]
MKKLTCFINDSKLLEKVESFCTKEKFILDAISSPDEFDYDAATVIYITDEPQKNLFPALKDTPVCIVGEGKADVAGLHYLRNDFEYIHLRCLVDAITHNGCFEQATISVEPVSTNRIYKIKNDIFNIEKIIFALTKDFVYFLNFSDLEKVRVGLSEMLTNAIEHGNLGITGDDKLHATEDGSYYDLVNQRLSSEQYISKLVTFTYKIDKEGIIIDIEDEGSGFNVEELPDPTDPESLLKLHGRGILITRMYFDDVSYNEKGNKVTLSKRF